MSKLTKKEIAKKIGKSISSLYYHHKREIIDNEIKSQIEAGRYPINWNRIIE